MAATSQVQLVSDVHMLLYPYLLYPLQAISLSASIFMTVAIALERYIAISQPFNHRYVMIYMVLDMFWPVFNVLNYIKMLTCIFVAYID